jgi:dephospho-CoA kinase
MKIVGVTGGIGSGKTTVAKTFEELGVPIFIADQEAKDIMDAQDDVKKKIIELLGAESYHDDKGIQKADRKFIASKVFNNKELLTSLNQIIHPAVALNFDKWKADSSYKYGIYEAAILFETGGDARCDHILLVAAPEAICIERVMQRDDVTRAQVVARMSHQWSQLSKLELSDLVIYNIDFDKTYSYVRIVHEFMLK